MKEGQRVRLKSDFTDDEMTPHIKGETGVILSDSSTGGKVLVEFDGYEEERKRDEELRQRSGEGYNIVSWLSSVPLDLLEVIE
jgi:hypothetical protein